MADDLQDENGWTDEDEEFIEEFLSDSDDIFSDEEDDLSHFLGDED